MTIRAQVEAYLVKRWPNGLQCPLCQSVEWLIPPDGVYTLEDRSWELSATGGPPERVVFLSCIDCGYVVQFNADWVLQQNP